MTTNKTILSTDAAVSDLGISTALLLTTRRRLDLLFSNHIKFNLKMWERYVAEGEDISSYEYVRARYKALDAIMTDLETKDYLIGEPNGRYGYDACLTDAGEMVRKADEPLDATELIDYTPAEGMTDSEVELAMWGWNYLLNRGQVYGYYAHSAFGDEFELFHILQCGINGNKSTMARVDTWESFDNTFAEDNLKDSVLRCYMTCRCDAVENLDVGDVDILSRGNSLSSLFKAIAHVRSFNYITSNRKV